MNKAKAHFNDPLCYYKIAYFIKDYINDKTVIVCIGTDRCIGDCLGPLVGTLLKERHFPLPVFGTVEDPIHALNLEEKLNGIKKTYPDRNIIGIDACLGDTDNIGEIQSRDYPVHPGKGVGKSLPNVGDASIIGIVDASEGNIFNNNTIRLNLILNMAKAITDAMLHAHYLYYSDKCYFNY
ncbi:spore protease YyaC [Clostridium rectalis]|uniref:spore protease YyaC n=1 Tax=Clostridium rectalis TaxID=2040295 RepID=UPI000F644AA2|nr:spore protease YyaC [Clostridium rectalis]